MFYDAHVMSSHMKSHIFSSICLEIGTKFADISYSLVLLIMTTQQPCIVETFVTFIAFKFAYTIVTSVMRQQISLLGGGIRTKLTFVFYILVDMDMALQETFPLKCCIAVFEWTFYTIDMLPIKGMHFQMKFEICLWRLFYFPVQFL